jgi:Mg2+ and Co2+ transporter CorA
MKLMGLSKGRLEVLEGIDPLKLRDYKADFAWADGDRLDSRTGAAMKELYGISSLSEYDLPAIIPQDRCTLIVISYYQNISRKSVQVIAAGNVLVTLHGGPDPVCDEVMASVNEMMVAGNFSASEVLYQLFSAAIARYAEYIRQMRQLMRNVGLQARSGGVSDLRYLFKLIRDSKALSAELEDTRQQISEIALRLAPLSIVKDPERFKDLYAGAHVLSALAEELSDEVALYEKELLLAVWLQMNRTRTITAGAVTFSLFAVAAAIFHIFVDQPVMGFAPSYFIAGLLLLGAITAIITMQFSVKFKLD